MKIYFLLLLFTGLRNSEVVNLLRTYDKNMLRVEDGVALYPLQWYRGTKKGLYAFMPTSLSSKIKRFSVSEYYYKNYYQRKGLKLRPKYIRKFAATTMFKLGLASEVVDFIQGRTPRSTLARHYLRLLPIAVKEYRKYSDYITELLKL